MNKRWYSHCRELRQATDARNNWGTSKHVFNEDVIELEDNIGKLEAENLEAENNENDDEEIKNDQ